MINSEELIGTTGHVTLYTGCRYNRDRLICLEGLRNTREASVITSSLPSEYEVGYLPIQIEQAQGHSWMGHVVQPPPSGAVQGAAK